VEAIQNGIQGSLPLWASLIFCRFALYLKSLCIFAANIIGNGYIYNYIKRKDKYGQGSFGFD